ncbi:siderophore-interacting protein [Aliamphritea ceti]|uniref:siderophore-interacting protein n=1 Tax=Aliamphritea ceti TaxID=1524258 RepID=UPI0021C44238|nr:siderophore-interacting protein [Aliamphritea ceti]
MHTPIQDIDHKIDIIDHVNQDHTEELLTIAHAHSPDLSIESVKITDIFKEGLQVSITPQTGKQASDVFIPFEIEGDLEEKILYSAYAAIAKQGSDFSSSRKRFFEVTHKQQLSKNFIRITVQSSMALPGYYPGYAYGFILKTIQKQPKNYQDKTTKSWLQKATSRFFIWLMKRLSSNSRQKMLTNMNKNVRLYTLRKSWKSNDSNGIIHHGLIDIFTHGDSPGSIWANNLNAGDIIASRSESKDKHPHLVTGQAVLIADETAFPALAGILEHWQNPVPPYVVIICTSADEQSYFDEVELPENTKMHKIICPAEQQAEEALSILKHLNSLDVVWAALEAEAAKTIRRYFRNDRNISGKHNHTKGYWRLRTTQND